MGRIPLLLRANQKKKKTSEHIPEARRVEFLEKFTPEKMKNKLRIVLLIVPNLDSRATKNKSLIKLERKKKYIFSVLLFLCYGKAVRSHLGLIMWISLTRAPRYNV